MCLPNFVEFRQIEESSAVVGYRYWRARIADPTSLISACQDYSWPPKVGRHEVTGRDSGIYAYNNYCNDNCSYYNNYYNDNYYYYYYYNYYYNNYYNDYYRISGIILQFGKVAIHRNGQRSEYAKIKTLFSIRESDAKGTKEFLKWVRCFNRAIHILAKVYNVSEVIAWQDFLESQKMKGS